MKERQGKGGRGRTARCYPLGNLSAPSFTGFVVVIVVVDLFGGPHPVMPKGYSWLCIQESLMVVLRELYGLQCPIVLLLQPIFTIDFKID